jgi:hypothetical protein
VSVCRSVQDHDLYFEIQNSKISKGTARESEHGSNPSDSLGAVVYFEYFVQVYDCADRDLYFYSATRESVDTASRGS